MIIPVYVMCLSFADEGFALNVAEHLAECASMEGEDAAWYCGDRKVSLHLGL